MMKRTNVTSAIRKAFAEAEDLRERKQGRPMCNICFLDDRGEEDETQFTCESMESAEDELDEFFSQFCKENSFDKEKVIKITVLDNDEE